MLPSSNYKGFASINRIYIISSKNWKMIGKLYRKEVIFINIIFLLVFLKIHEKEIITILSQETSREIIMFITEQGSPTQTDITNKIKISASSINWHLNRLLHSNLIEEIKDGKYKRYILNSEISSLYVRKLLKNYYPQYLG